MDVRFSTIQYHDDRPLPFGVVKLFRGAAGISGETVPDEHFATMDAAITRAAQLQKEYDAND